MKLDSFDPKIYFPGYKPSKGLWDTWYLEDNGIAHVFHLMDNGIGHAISDDLIRWQELPKALENGSPGELDDDSIFTGWAYKENGIYYLYYCMRKKSEGARMQRMGLATSKDGINFEKYPGNPIIVPEEPYYVSPDYPDVVKLDCRDMVVVNNPDGPGYYGFYAANRPAEEECERACISCLFSEDLINWKHLPPAFAPADSGEVEVPDVFYLNGIWYLTCLTSTNHGNRPPFSEYNYCWGTMYAVSNSVQGPYKCIKDDYVLLGGKAIDCGISLRSLNFEGKRYALFTECNNSQSCLSPPMEVITLPDGKLRLAYNERLKKYRKECLIDNETPEIFSLPYTHGSGGTNAGRWKLENGIYYGESRTGWQVAQFSIGSRDMEINARITIEKGTGAGIVFVPDNTLSFTQNNTLIAFDAEKQCVILGRLPQFDPAEYYKFPVKHNREYNLKVLIRQPRYEVFVDDILVGTCALRIDEIKNPGFGLFVEKGRTSIKNLLLYSLGGEVYLDV